MHAPPTRTAQTAQFATIHSFTGTDGYQPQGALILGSDGALYGTTYGEAPAVTA